MVAVAVAVAGLAWRSPWSCSLMAPSSWSAEPSQRDRRDAEAPRSASTSSSFRWRSAPTANRRATPAGARGASSQQKLQTQQQVSHPAPSRPTFGGRKQHKFIKGELGITSYEEINQTSRAQCWVFDV